MGYNSLADNTGLS